MNPQSRHTWGLAFGLCLITLAVNLQAPLYTAYARASGDGAGATAVAFSCYVLGVLPVLLAFGGIADRVGRKPLILLALGLSMLATMVTSIWPNLIALGLARLMMGVGTGLASATATAYMSELMAGGDTRAAANRVTASTSLGFGLGAALTSLFLIVQHSVVPGSFWLQLALAALAILVVARLPDPAPRNRHAPLLRLPLFPTGSLPYSFSMLLAWATSGLVIAILPSVLAAHALQQWSGLSTFTVISCGLLFQPWARRLQPARATGVGLLVLPLSYALLAWGASSGSLLAVLLGALGASSACYGFLYLGGLSAITAMAGLEKARGSAGFFLFAYIGFSLPVVVTGVVADAFGANVALVLFGLALTLGALATGWVIVRTQACAADVRSGTRSRKSRIPYSQLNQADPPP
ncbi:MFS transporter [Pseudomonas citrulli]|uniref:MFS transporter n=1 Tax=Pseudomonas citrulli TaxID=3064347 RepID=A0ABT9BX32_9PSED|nr:MFS transporter [Pseudomonas sp. K18]MDO7895888.1 MFS transporter [Pseudomonas sp. K18]